MCFTISHKLNNWSQVKSQCSTSNIPESSKKSGILEFLRKISSHATGAHEYWLIQTKRKTAPTKWFSKNTPKAHWHAVASHLTFLSVCINLEDLTAQKKKKTEKVYWTAKSLKERKKFNICFLLYSNKIRNEIYSSYKTPKSSKSSPIAKENSMKAHDPSAGMGDAKGLD